MGPSSERAREHAEESDIEPKPELRDDSFEPASDAYAQAELTSRSERMERMVEKARESI